MLSSSRLSRLVAFLGCLIAPALASAQQPLQFNVPYSCQDGITRIIQRCEKNARGGEVCFWREEKNGQLIVERFNVRGQMDGWLATCKAPAAQPAASPAPAQAAAPAVAPPPMPVARPGQALNPPYLAGMPSPDVVKQRIQGTNAVDTLARQVAVLNRLPRLIERMRMAPERGYNLTPDEQQAANAYNLTSYQMSQAYIKSAMPEAAKAFQQMVGRYEDDAALNNQMMGLLSPATMADYRRVDGGASARAQVRYEEQLKENERLRALPENPTAGAQPMRNDPGTVEVRRCFELGGGAGECVSKGLMTGFMESLVGGAPAQLMKDVKQIQNPPGVRIGGTFTGPAGLTIYFDNGGANLSKCGKLESDGRGYTVTKRGSQLQVDIDNKPKPLVLVLGPNNVFTGPATQPITGNVIVGYRTEVREQRYVVDNTVVPGSQQTIQVPIYEERTVTCGFASLRATAPAQSQANVVGLADTAGAIGSVVSQILGGKADPAAERSGTLTAPAGPRMGGTYAGGNFKVEFRATAAILDCGQAHVMRPYDVQNLVDRLVVTVRNGNAPASFTLRPDGTLAGSGSVEVAGRLVSGFNDNAGEPTFTPHTERCAVSTLAVTN